MSGEVPRPSRRPRPPSSAGRIDHTARAHHDAVEPSRPTRRQVLGRLKTAGLVAAASGLPWGSLVRARRRRRPACLRPAPPRPGSSTSRRSRTASTARSRSRTAMLNCNAAVIVNRDHVLVVDTHSKPSAAKALIRQIRDEITELPVRYVVDSHLHGDHAMGNEAYPEVFGAECRGDLLGEDARVAGEARRAADEGVARRPAEADRRPPRQAGGEPGRVRSAPPSGHIIEGLDGVSEGDDAPARDAARR